MPVHGEQRLPLNEHHQEIKRLQEVVQGCARGTGKVLFLQAQQRTWLEPLVAAAKSDAASHGLPFIEEFAHHSPRGDGAPWQDIADRYVAVIESRGSIDARLAQDYRRLTTALSGGLHGALTGKHTLSSLNADFLYDLIGRFLVSCTQACPAVIALHDLDDAEPATKAVLRSFIEQHLGAAPSGRLPSTPFRGLLLITSRHLDPWVQSLTHNQDNRCEIISLARFDEELVRHFLTQPEVVQRFLQSCGGSLEHLDTIVESLPRGPSTFIARRLERLSAPAMQCLEYLAALEVPTEVAWVARLTEAPGRSFSESLQELTQHHLVQQSVHKGRALLHIESPQVRQQVYASLPPERRAAYHAAIGRLLEAQRDLGHTVDLECLATHFLRSEEAAPALRYAMRAAERLHMTFAYAPAMVLLEAALPLAQAADDRRLILERLVELHFSLAELPRALYYCAKLKRLHPPTQQAALAHRIAHILLEMGRFASALRLLQRHPPTPEAELAHRLSYLALEAEALFGAGHRNDAESCCIEALALCPEAHPATMRQHLALRNTLGKVYIAHADYGQAHGIFCQNRQQAQAARLPDEEIRAHFNCGIALVHLRHFGAAEKEFEDCLAYEHISANPVIRAFCLLNLAVIAHEEERWRAAYDYYLHAIATFKRSGNRYQLAAAMLNAAEINLDLGVYAQCQALLDACDQLLAHEDIQHYRAWLCLLQGRLAFATGKVAAAMDLSNEALTLAQEKRWAKCPEVLLWRCHFQVHSAIKEDLQPVLERLSQLELSPQQTLWLRALQTAAQHPSMAPADVEAQLTTLDRAWAEAGLLLPRLHLVSWHLGATANRLPAWRLEAAQALLNEALGRMPESLHDHFLAKQEVQRILRACAAALSGDPTDGADDAALPTFPVQAERIDPQGLFCKIVGQDPRVVEILNRVHRVAAAASPVLLLGESGTGKELLAEAIHLASPRAQGPFVRVNCGALVENLLLSELFGHEKGAFTGALSRKPGRFELAENGTIFLDEIADTSPATQVALLRVIQEGTYERVGGTQTLSTNARIVCATNQRLDQLVKNGSFRLDLYYRLKGIIFELPPLRERRADIPIIAADMLHKMAPEGQRPHTLAPEAMHYLLAYSWPGNIRELQNFLRTLTLFAAQRHIAVTDIHKVSDFFTDGELCLDDPSCQEILAALPPTPEVDPDVVAESQPVFVDAVQSTATTAIDPPSDLPSQWVRRVLDGQMPLHDLKKELELQCIREALQATNGNISRAAALLQMKRPRLSQIISATPPLQECLASLHASGQRSVENGS